jgi:hypothetical protein
MECMPFPSCRDPRTNYMMDNNEFLLVYIPRIMSRSSLVFLVVKNKMPIIEPFMKEKNKTIRVDNGSTFRNSLLHKGERAL